MTDTSQKLGSVLRVRRSEAQVGTRHARLAQAEERICQSVDEGVGGEKGCVRGEAPVLDQVVARMG
jgi:hypothetical protein